MSVIRFFSKFSKCECDPHPDAKFYYLVHSLGIIPMSFLNIETVKNAYLKTGMKEREGQILVEMSTQGTFEQKSFSKQKELHLQNSVSIVYESGGKSHRLPAIL